MLDAQGELCYIIHRVEDVTEFARLKHLTTEREQITEELRSEAARMEAEIFRRAQDIQVANQQLRTLQAELELRVEARTSELRREMRERERAEDALRESEDQLRQSQKLEAIGQLAGGISHDFNNLLTVILGYGEAVRADAGLSAEARSDLDEMLKAGHRAAELTRQLLIFSRQQLLELHVLDLNGALASLQSMLPRVLGEDIELRFTQASDLDPIRADPGQLQQLVMNLAVNARDAMPRGGKLLIETANCELDEYYAAEHLEISPGRFVMLSVSDTGKGMDRRTQARIFEPFFTTKERGKGTGLGLSTVFGVVKQCGGSIWLQSEPGRGTTFKLYFPSHLDAGPRTQPSARADARMGGTETVLLVEDDEQVREVADLVRAARPAIKVLFMSGYTDDVILQHRVLESDAEFIQKPLTSELLTRKVRSVLDAGPPAN